MSKLLPLLPFAAALSLLACQNEGPVAENVTPPPDVMVGDRSATGLAAPGNSAAAEAVDRAALPPMSLGMAWSVAPDGRSASFGPPESESILTFSCAGRGSLLVTRHHPASPGSKATLSFTGSGHVASLPVAAVPTSGGPGQAEWQGRADGDIGRAIQRSFSRTGQVQITIGGTPSLVVPADPKARAVFANCLQA